MATRHRGFLPTNVGRNDRFLPTAKSFCLLTTSTPGLHLKTNAKTISIKTGIGMGIVAAFVSLISFTGGRTPPMKKNKKNKCNGNAHASANSISVTGIFLFCFQNKRSGPSSSGPCDLFRHCLQSLSNKRIPKSSMWYTVYLRTYF